MNKKILIVYASKCGSTAEVAQALCQDLLHSGAAVEVLPVREVRSLKGVDAVVIGTAIRMGKPLGEANRFVNQFKADLKQIPTAVFSVGVAMNEDTPAARTEAAGYIAPLVANLSKNAATATFGGKLDYKTLPALFRFMFSKDTSGKLHEGDWRNWDAIDAWADTLPAALGLTA